MRNLNIELTDEEGATLDGMAKRQGITAEEAGAKILRRDIMVSAKNVEVHGPSAAPEPKS